MPTWKVYLIQFLNIAGTGPIFGAIQGILFGPAAYLWIVLGCIFGGAVHDYMSGMISIRMNGASLPEIIGDNLGRLPRLVMRVLALGLMTLVGAVFVTTPADHLIYDKQAFDKAVNDVIEYASCNRALMTMGITPTGPETAYGYIQVTGGKTGAQSGKPVKVKTFTEKPDQDLAEVFYKSGEFFWNSGIFAWKASLILEEMKKHLPDVVSVFNGWESILGTPSEKTFLEKAYSECPKISIDYGVMEKTDIAWLYSGNFGWSDIDNWDSLFNTVKVKDEEGNATNTSKRLFNEDSDNLVVTENKKKIYAIKGLNNFLVIDTDDALLICPRDDKQFKEFLTGLGMPGYEEFR